jgi:hypothetical protein
MMLCLQTYSTSSGFVISGRQILTNAHSVEHYTVVKVKKRGCDQKFIAKVLAIGNECDIALLTGALVKKTRENKAILLLVF